MAYFSRDPDYEGFQTLRRFVDSVALVLNSGDYRFSASMARLLIGLANGPNNTGITIMGDGNYIVLHYVESWDEGPLSRERADRVVGRLELMRPVLLEMLSRLNAGQKINPTT